MIRKTRRYASIWHPQRCATPNLSEFVGHQARDGIGPPTDKLREEFQKFQFVAYLALPAGKSGEYGQVGLQGASEESLTVMTGQRKRHVPDILCVRCGDRRGAAHMGQRGAGSNRARQRCAR